MQVSTQNNRVNFTSTPLHPVNLRKFTNGAQDGFVKAVFSKLDPNNLEDLAALKEIETNADSEKSAILRMLCGFFPYNCFQNDQYHCLELVGEGSLAQRIVGLLNTTPGLGDKKAYVGKLIATVPRFKYGKDDRGIKGVGEVMLGETFNLAKKGGFERLSFDSTKNPFYDETFRTAKVNVQEREISGWDSARNIIIPKTEFDKYINYCEDKYKFKFNKKKHFRGLF